MSSTYTRGPAPVLDATRPARPSSRPSESPSRPATRAQYCAACAEQLEEGAVLRGGLLYCSFECAAYASGRVPGVYLG